MITENDKVSISGGSKIEYKLQFWYLEIILTLKRNVLRMYMRQLYLH